MVEKNRDCSKKLCKKCCKIKALTEFTKNKAMEDGLSRNCALCCSKYSRYFYWKNAAPTKKYRRGKNYGPLNTMWKGDDVQYISLHMWVRRHFPPPSICTKCREKKRLDLANVSGKYKRGFSNWVYLCRKCHMLSDGRLDKFAKLHVSQL